MAAAKPDTWMPLYIGDYLADTSRLTTEGHGAYLLLIMDYWVSGGPLPDDDDQLAAIAKLPMRNWKKLRPVLVRFFDVQEGLWRHKRIDQELEKAREITEKRRRAGQASAAARAQQNGNTCSTHVGTEEGTEGATNGQQTGRPSPSPSPRENYGGAAAPPDYAFVGKVIRLKPDQFNQWRETYGQIPDFIAELQAADDYYAENPPKDGKWFFPVSNWLKKANNEAAARKKEATRGEDWW